MEQSCFSEAVASLSDLIEEYNELDATKGAPRTDPSRLKIAVWRRKNWFKKKKQKPKPISLKHPTTLVSQNELQHAKLL